MELVKNEFEETEKAHSKNNIVKVVYTLKPLFFIQKIFGIIIFNLTNGDVRPTNRKMKTIGLLIPIAYYVLLFVSFAISPPSPSENPTLKIKFFCVATFMTFLEYIIPAIMTSFSKYIVHINFLTAFAKLDASLRVEKISAFYKKSHSETLQYLFGFFVNITINSTVFFTTVNNINIIYILLLAIEFFQKFQIIFFVQ